MPAALPNIEARSPSLIQFVRTEIPDVVVIEPDVHKDARGFFLETYHVEKYRAGGITAPFVQDNHSRSVARTLRGLHLQRRHPQGKLVRVIEGEIYDVAVDVRLDSPTFGQWVAVTLSSENFKQIYVPPGFAHGFCVLSELAQVEYKCTDLYNPADEIGVAWNDAALGITWPITDPILSLRDQGHRPLAEVRALLADTGPVVSQP
jgi:dTDP-4-dehydrorhamnose 3,5-epimerase